MRRLTLHHGSTAHFRTRPRSSSHLQHLPMQWQSSGGAVRQKLVRHVASDAGAGGGPPAAVGGQSWSVTPPVTLVPAEVPPRWSAGTSGPSRTRGDSATSGRAALSRGTAGRRARRGGHGNESVVKIRQQASKKNEKSSGRKGGPRRTPWRRAALTPRWTIARALASSRRPAPRPSTVPRAGSIVEQVQAGEVCWAPQRDEEGQ